MTCRLLANLSDALWSLSVQHPKHGAMTLEMWVSLQERHIPHHLHQMLQNYEEWAKTHPQRRPPRIPRQTEMAVRGVRALPRAC